MTAGIDKFTPTPEEQKLFDEVFYQESDIDVKETEPQREGFSLSVALDSLKISSSNFGSNPKSLR